MKKSVKKTTPVEVKKVDKRLRFSLSDKAIKKLIKLAAKAGKTKSQYIEGLINEQ